MTVRVDAAANRTVPLCSQVPTHSTAFLPIV
jgi:hypothetical protein